MKEKLLNVKQASEILGLRPKSLYQWKWLRVNLPFIKVGKSLRVSEEDLMKFINDRKTKIEKVPPEKEHKQTRESRRKKDERSVKSER